MAFLQAGRSQTEIADPLSGEILEARKAAGQTRTSNFSHIRKIAFLAHLLPVQCNSQAGLQEGLMGKRGGKSERS
jgi:hypothetical protein